MSHRHSRSRSRSRSRTISRSPSLTRTVSRSSSLVRTLSILSLTGAISRSSSLTRTVSRSPSPARTLPRTPSPGRYNVRGGSPGPEIVREQPCYIRGTRYTRIKPLSERVDLIIDANTGKKYTSADKTNPIYQYGRNYIHKNIAKQIVDDHYIIFPYFEKGSLENYLERQQTYLDNKLILKFFFDACNVVQYLHGNNKIGIDIRARNFYINDNDDLVLLKIGRKWNLVSSHSKLYCAPELLDFERNEELGQAVANRDMPNDKRSDIWSLGCLLYALIYLKSPYQDEFRKYGHLSAHSIGGNIEYPSTRGRLSMDLYYLMCDMLNYDYQMRPYIDDVIYRLQYSD